MADKCPDCGREKWQHTPVEDFPCGVRTSNSSNDPLRLDDPLSEAQLAHIVKWYEDEVSEPEHAATHDCYVVRAFRELLRLKRPTIETFEQHDAGTTKLAISMLERFRDGRLQTAEGTHTSLLGPRDQLLQEADWFDHAVKVLRSTLKAIPQHAPGCWKLQSPSGQGVCNCGAETSHEG